MNDNRNIQPKEKKKFIQLCKDNSDLIQAIAAIIQVLIAGLMLVTLYYGYLAYKQGNKALEQGNKTLNITSRQLESSIEPVLTLWMNDKIIRITNEGSIAVRNISITGIIVGWYDLNKRTITEYQILRPDILLSNAVIPPQKYFDLNVETMVTDIAPLPNFGHPLNYATGSIVYGLVIRYRRSADMKPFNIFFPYTLSKLGNDKIYMSLSPSSPGPTEAGIIETDETGAMKTPSEMIRNKIISLYKQTIAPIKPE
jgi:hypothetical protein